MMFVALGIYAAAIAVEIILSAKWNLPYFTIGVPIFARRIERSEGLDGIDLDALQKAAATVAATPLLFRRAGPDLILFREKAFGGAIHYFPIMHGVIRHERGEPSVRVVGLANWWVLAGIAILTASLGADVLIMAPYLGIALAVLYLIAGVRYNRVAKALRRNAAVLGGFHEKA